MIVKDTLVSVEFSSSTAATTASSVRVASTVRLETSVSPHSMSLSADASSIESVVACIVAASSSIAADSASALSALASTSMTRLPQSVLSSSDWRKRIKRTPFVGGLSSAGSRTFRVHVTVDESLRRSSGADGGESGYGGWRG